MQLRPLELLFIGDTIKAVEGCRLLVFGVGNDSPYWAQLNATGRTTFLEDNPDWLDSVRDRAPFIDARFVSYRCNVTQWQEVLEDERALVLDLPVDIREGAWDVVLVDAPLGYNEDDPSFPGRMSSIYMASRLVADGGFVFVHDAQRRVERVYCEKYLKKEYLAGEVHGRALLQRYHIRARATL